MKESGINYFAWDLGLSTGDFGVLYTFEEEAGTTLNSISGGQTQYSGILNSATNFWVKPGSGFFSGNHAVVSNASGLDSTSWTQVFVYERVNANECILFNSLTGSSGWRVGLTKSNKPYMQSFNQEPVTAASSNSYSSKNAVTFAYLPNYLTIGYYNFNTQRVEAETFDYPFGVTRSDEWKLGPQFTGYMDYFIHRTDYLSPDVQGQLLSGLFARPTGIEYDVQTICTTGITGYQDVVVTEAGVTGYNVTPGGDEGRDYFTGQFPLYHTQSTLTGFLSTGLYSSGVSGDICYPVTGGQTVLLELLTGYASSFGMQKVQLFSYIEPADVNKFGFSYVPFLSVYNKNGLWQYSGYQTPEVYGTGQINLFLNGVAQANSGWAPTGEYIVITGANFQDAAFFDIKSGDHKSFPVTAGVTGFAFTYSGQEIFLNGLNLISGYDFVVTGGILSITNRNTGVYGEIFEYPIVLPYVTGSLSMQTGAPFWRSTSNVYFNGVRQQLNILYVEGAVFDLLSGNSFNPAVCDSLYDNTDDYWE